MKIFGKQIGIVAVLMLLVIGVGSAAVVSYLSNQVDADVTVSSPFTVEISTDNGVTYGPGPVTLASKVGGEISTFHVKYTNLGNQPISMQIETLITCDASGVPGVVVWNDITHADFENSVYSVVADREKQGIYVSSTLNGGYYFNGPVNYEPMTHLRTIAQTGPALAVVGGASGAWPQPFPGNGVAIAQIDLYHAPNALGKYTITTEVQDDSTPWI